MASVDSDTAAAHPARSEDKNDSARQIADMPSDITTILQDDKSSEDGDRKMKGRERMTMDAEPHELAGAGGKAKEDEHRRSLKTSRPQPTLPPEILRNIFKHIDPEAFASASLVSRSWRLASDDPKLYAHQLHQISPHTAAEQYEPQHQQHSIPSTEDDSLPALKRLFAREAKRRLYTPFIRPKITTISLVSESPLSSFAAGPGGEKFEFTFSHFARWCLAVSSSRIYIVDLSGSQEVTVTKELKVRRRPLAVDILPDGALMAVLSSDHSVSLYSVEDHKVELKRSVDLDNTPYTIAMSPGGEVLAAAFDGGLELCSLREGASPTEKRSVKTHRMDKVMFSGDGSVLLGTTQGRDPATVILTAPYFSAAEFEMSPSELVDSMWTRQILFPTSSRDCSHSTLLPRNGDQDSNWTLTYDRTYESFRAVRTDDLRNGTTYFTGPQTGSERPVVWPKDALVPTTLPTATTKGDLVAAGFKGSEVWIYGVPEHLDATSSLHSLAGQPIAQPDRSAETSGDTNDADALPRWQMLVDKHRNVFSRGRKVAEVSNMTSMCWTKRRGSSSSEEMIAERLVIAAPGGVGSDTSLEEETPIDGGRIVILDFGLQPFAQGTDRTIELGIREPQLLEEQSADFETEIARMRRRTMAQRDTRVKSVLDALRPDNALEDVPEVPSLPGPSTEATQTRAVEPVIDISDDDEPGVTLEEAASFAEGPYSHTAPRSRTALYRSATVNQASRFRVQQARQPEAPPPPAPLPLRRQDGTEVPDESDADNWVPPPPPYQRHADELLPDDLVQRALLYNGIAPMPSTAESMVRPRRSSSLNDRSSQSHRRRSSVEIELLAHQLRRPVRQASDLSINGTDGASTVSSVSVTPRSSIRRRPLTVYQSSSSALRESAAMSRPGSQVSGSQISRTHSVGSSARISRSESLRRTSQAGGGNGGNGGSETAAVSLNSAAALSAAAAAALEPHSAALPGAHSPVNPPLDQIPDWPLFAPSEDHEEISPTEEPSPQSESVPIQDLDTEPPITPETKAVTLPEPSSPNGGNLPEPVTHSPTTPQSVQQTSFESTPRSQRTIQNASSTLQSQASPAQLGEATEESNMPSSYRLKEFTEMAASAEAPAEASVGAEQLSFGEHQPLAVGSSEAEHEIDFTSQPMSISDDPLPEAVLVGPSLGSIPAPLQEMRNVAPDQSLPPHIQELQAQSIAQELPAAQTEPTPQGVAAIPEPSIQQLEALQNRPRPLNRQLSGASNRSRRAPSPRMAPMPVPVPTPAPVSPHVQAAAELPNLEAAPRVKPTGPRRRISQRLRAAVGRGDDEPMPELPQVPQFQASVNAAQSGPARHSRMYANARSNASEPALRARPEAQRLDTIQSVNTQHVRTPSREVPHGFVANDAQRPEGRPAAKRRMSIFSRRKSKDVGKLRPQEDAPPIPNVPNLPMPPQVPAVRADSAAGRASPIPGQIRRAATDRDQPVRQNPFGHGAPNDDPRYGGRPYYEAHIEAGRSKKGKSKDKDGKCVVM